MNCEFCHTPAPIHELSEGVYLGCWVTSAKSSETILNAICEAMKVPTGAKREAWAAMLSNHFEFCAIPECNNKRKRRIFQWSFL